MKPNTQLNTSIVVMILLILSVPCIVVAIKSGILAAILLTMAFVLGGIGDAAFKVMIVRFFGAVTVAVLLSVVYASFFPKEKTNWVVAIVFFFLSFCISLALPLHK